MTAANTGKRKKSKTWTLKSKLIPAIRKIWLYSPLRREVLARAKEGRQWRCNECKELFDKVHVDHIKPIVSVKTGFTTWDSYLNATFCDPKSLQSLCEQCHSAKSTKERELRKIYNKKRKKDDK